MAVSKDGPLGLYSGKIGPIYGYILNGKQILRAARHKSTIPRSEKQLAVQQKLTVLTVFFKHITEYINVGFMLSARKRNINPNNAAKSYNLSNAITGQYPAQILDFTAVRLTEGSLSVASNPQVTSVVSGIKFSWTYDANDPDGSRKDKTMLMAYFPAKKIASYLISGVQRDQTEETLIIADTLKGEEAETYISFVRDDRKAISNSIYTGRITF
jgi:hypothetical protein